MLAEVEKETSTLEKGKEEEDRSKYYLSYPNLPVLVITQEICEINVVEQANIPKFSNLDDIVTPLRLLELIFDVLVDMIVGYAKLYSHREKANNNFEITNEKIHLFVSICYCLVVAISFQTVI